MTLPPRAAHRFEEIRNVAEPVTIAVDVMGGDRGPAVVLRGALQALEALSLIHISWMSRCAAKAHREMGSSARLMRAARP